jgi:hypothetical protein
VILGDARLTLADVPDGRYDALVIDAFSSDSIPVHLLTREALALYRRKLTPDGVVLFHISNRYLDLAPVLAALADDSGMPGRHLIDFAPQLGSAARTSAEVVALGQSSRSLDFLSASPGGRICPRPPRCGPTSAPISSAASSGAAPTSGLPSPNHAPINRNLPQRNLGRIQSGSVAKRVHNRFSARPRRSPWVREGRQSTHLGRSPQLSRMTASGQRAGTRRFARSIEWAANSCCCPRSAGDEDEPVVYVQGG